MTNATIMFAAFIVSAVSVIIVFVSGMMSGVVRTTTLLTRTFYAFLMSGAASYLLLMIFDWYYERQHKKFSAEQPSQDKPAEENKQEGFQPINANELPKA